MTLTDSTPNTIAAIMATFPVGFDPVAFAKKALANLPLEQRCMVAGLEGAGSYRPLAERGRNPVNPYDDEPELHAAWSAGFLVAMRAAPDDEE